MIAVCVNEARESSTRGTTLFARRYFFERGGELSEILPCSC
jgi:hypothetical protein